MRPKMLLMSSSRSVETPWPDLFMISARGPDSASADEPRIDVRAPLLRVARQTPDRSTKRRPASAGASNRAVGPASNPFPSGLLPSGIGMAKPTLQQARDRAEVLWGPTRPEWVTSAGSLERLLTGARNGLGSCHTGLFSAGERRQIGGVIERRPTVNVH